MPENDFWSILFAFIVLCAVLVLAYFSARWLGKRSGAGRGRGNIEILDRQYVSQDKCLMIVRVGARTMLIGVASEQITKLSDLDEAELNIANSFPQTDFATALRKAVEKVMPGSERGKDGNGPKGGQDS